jgi:hypothetical protein
VKQPGKNNGAKIGIIIGAIVLALAIIGFCVWFFFFRGGGNTPTPTGEPATTPSSQGSKQNTIPTLSDYYRNNIVTQNKEASKDYTMDYGGDYDTFRSAQAVGGAVCATFDDIDGDGEIEMIVVMWDFNQSEGTGINRVTLYDVDNGTVKRVDDGKIESDRYGGCDYTAQVAYEKKDGKLRFYFTTICTVTPHEGGFCEPMVTVYDYSSGNTTKIYNTRDKFSSGSTSSELIDEFANAKEYLPNVYNRFASAINKDNYTQVSGWTREQKDQVPMFAQLDKFEPNIKMLAINYFMRSREAGAGMGTASGVFYGYWETFTGKNTSAMYNGLERLVATPVTGTTPVASGDYIIPDSSTRLLTTADVEKLNVNELRIARNEIYARHGRKFQDADLQKYFESKSWYKGTIEAKDFDDNSLTDIEKKNRDLIQEYEKKLG